MFATIALAATLTTKPAPLNVIVLFTDDHRRTAIGHKGIEPVLTPNIDKLYQQGTSFDNATTMGGPHGALCTPSRAMLLSGRNVWHLGQRKPEPKGLDGSFIPPEHTTWPEVFKQAGYQTFGAGKWHNDKGSYARLFTHGSHIFFGGMHFPNVGGHFSVNVHKFNPEGKYPESNRKAIKTYSSELFANGAINFLSTQRDKSKPFAMYVSFSSPHDPREAPKRFHDLYNPKNIQLPPNFAPKHPFNNGDMKVRDELLSPVPRTPARTKQDIADYYAMVTEVDHHIGRILNELKRQKLDKNTLVVFLGDNGLAVGQHGLLGKQSVYEHSMGVPLVFRGPNIPKNQSRSTFVHHHDVAPTILQLANLPVPQTMESISLTKSLKSPSHTVRKYMVNCYQNKQRSIRRGNDKLILYNVNGTHYIQLFDLAKDPWETNNLAYLPQNDAKILNLKNQLHKQMKEQTDPALPGFFYTPNQASIQ